MARRGSYAKGIAKREEILDAALDIVARVGYSRTTVRELAQAVGLSQTGLLHYFGTKEQLFVEILRRRDEVDQRVFGVSGDGARAEPADLPRAFTALVRHNTEVPGLVQLYSRLSSEAAEPDHPAHAFFRDRYDQARSEVATFVREQQAAGSLRAALDPERLAVMLFALMDGLQAQWMYNPEIDMAEQLGHFWELVANGPGKEEVGSAPPTEPAANNSGDQR
ncbi:MULTISPECIES: TetR/AcrR family transcriptional regulator [unclassified Streptomyces]|uniref:TetR/AcrR family transcriptional regulator n=1 Tax=unclassified Streptomyces TaxID=2593676 RepID=UPI00352DD980|nr:TetR/AcrR family transcriptional regulator [Streptomyces sp. NBC_01213]